MKAFWKFLLQRNLNQWWLEGVHYAVFGLGDSGSQKYNILEQWLLLKEVWAMISTLQERDLVEETCPPFLSSCPDI
ncbi:NADPH-dependent diflavin oxidoreductase 1 [Vitis vinifera]|uniref:NADPH-dependent diflavin oxidoreductase 1 n=1 Tax=Vitis vinifera TaxID=29760 RepID=A0A438DM01_VITVI|nr:NADPH-dependent diflavin oxidoreductase 1 [Vitis vinifera]